MKKTILYIFVVSISLQVFSQIAINTTTPDPSAALDINAQKGASFGGLKLPVVADDTERGNINASPNDTGLLIFNQASNCIEIYDGDINTWYPFDNCGSVPSTNLLEEDFETDGSGGVRYTLSTSDDLSDNQDYFRRTNGNFGLNPISAFFNNRDGIFFAAQDIDGLTGTPPPNQFLTFNAITVVSGVQHTLSMFLAEDDYTSNSWDDDDFFIAEVSYDNGVSWNSVIAVESTVASGTGGETRIDTDFNGVGDGTRITDTFTQFTANFTPNSTSVILRLNFRLNAGDEDIAVDNIIISN